MRTLFLSSLLSLIACGSPGTQTGQMQIVDTPAGKLAVDVTYAGDRQPSTCALAIRGAGSDARYYSGGLTQTFVGAGFTFAAVNLPGTSRNPGTAPPGDSIGLAAQSAAIHSVALHLRARCSRLAYVGHSAGAAIALLAQAEYADAQAIAVQAFSIAPYDPGVPPQVLSDLLAKEYAEYPIALRAQFFLTLPTPTAAEVQADIAAADHVPRALLRDVLALFSNSAPVRAADIRVPVYVQQSNADLLYPPVLWGYGADQIAYSGVPHCFECGQTATHQQIRSDVRGAVIRMLGGAP